MHCHLRKFWDQTQCIWFKSPGSRPRSRSRVLNKTFHLLARHPYFPLSFHSGKKSIFQFHIYGFMCVETLWLGCVISSYRPIMTYVEHSFLSKTRTYSRHLHRLMYTTICKFKSHYFAKLLDPLGHQGGNRRHTRTKFENGAHQKSKKRTAARCRRETERDKRGPP